LFKYLNYTILNLLRIFIYLTTTLHATTMHAKSQNLCPIRNSNSHIRITCSNNIHTLIIITFIAGFIAHCFLNFFVIFFY